MTLAGEAGLSMLAGTFPAEGQARQVSSLVGKWPSRALDQTCVVLPATIQYQLEGV
jgi:hypothetical protein